MGSGWIGMVVAWVLVLGLIVWLVSRLFPGPTSPDPRSLLDARLASGRIDLAEHTRLSAVLDTAGDQPSPMR